MHCSAFAIRNGAELVSIQVFFSCSSFNVLCNARNIFCCCLQHITGAPTGWDPAPEKDSINFNKKRFKNINVSVSSIGKVQWVTEGYSRMGLRNRIPDATSVFPDSAGTMLA